MVISDIDTVIEIEGGYSELRIDKNSKIVEIVWFVANRGYGKELVKTIRDEFDGFSLSVVPMPDPLVSDTTPEEYIKFFLKNGFKGGKKVGELIWNQGDPIERKLEKSRREKIREMTAEQQREMFGAAEEDIDPVTGEWKC